MPKHQVGLFDASFPGYPSCSMAGEADFAPELLEYVRNSFLPVTFYTDMKLDYVLEAPDDVTNVALLIEPPATSDTHYRRAFELQDYFHYILSFDVRFCESLPNNKGLFYPYGGNWLPYHVADRVPEKTKLCSFILSDKQSAPGHKLRHEILPLAKKYNVDIYGRGINPIDSKRTALLPYYYSIVVESCQLDCYFSEKLIDAFTCLTVPIYWGSPTIDKYFDIRGMFVFNNLEELEGILSSLSRPGIYVSSNYTEATKYSIAEDWIVRKYSNIFEKEE